MSILRIPAIQVAPAALMIAFVAGPASAEFMDCSGSKVLKQESSREVVVPGPNRELAQVSRVWRVSSKNPVFNGIDETVYMHLDHLNGTGTHTGYWILELKDGEKLRAKFEGVHYTVTRSGHWETVFQGVFRFISGTGKYEAIRGGGYYHGMENSASGTEEYSCSASY